MAASKEYVIGIDPGLTSGGLVAWDGDNREVLAAYTYTWTPKKRKDTLDKREHDVGDIPFTDAVLIAEAQAQRMLDDLDTVIKKYGQPMIIGIESFVDQRHRAREEKGHLIKERWKTPLLMGTLVKPLSMRGYNTANGSVLWQNAGVVLRHRREELTALAKKDENFLSQIMHNYSILSNDHLRKAWAHADWAWSRRHTNTKE